ncbi:hypothetical protein [Fictibacillus arsenicus]|uniref:Uncharacterized protein n=1 Tax=Fictibacillus arsenicus TaxID=255247 RepID=A0A1V3GBI1_9BACL|nr:hypothetical protein [Fictibacillus arsenicus]OOE14062.1 hypothetical protein UN64_02290 [Fictibacillus arsenicus]
MPTWLALSGALLIFWTVFWFIIYKFQLWTISFPLSKSTVLKAMVTIIIPVSWLTTTLIFGVFLAILKEETFFELFTLVFFPLILLILILLVLYLENIKYHKIRKNEQNELNEIKNNIILWLNQFSFLTQKNYDLQIFISKNKPVGKIIIHDVSNEEASRLKESKNQLPSTVSLLIFERK